MRGRLELISFITVSCITLVDCVALQYPSDDVLLRLQALEDEVTALKSQLIDTQGSQGNDVDESIYSLSSRSKRAVRPRTLRHVSDDQPEVGFHVTRSDRTFFVAHEGDKGATTIYFNDVKTNIGTSLYQVEEGHFQCNIPGTYFFSMSVVSARGRVEAAIVLKTGGRYSVLSKTMSESQRSQGTTTAIVRLNQNDQVSLQILDPSSLVQLVGHHMTSFSGYLLRTH